MDRDTTDPLRRWLAAEARTDAAAAEEALGRLLALLDDPRPAAGFSGRALARIRAGRSSAAPPVSLWARAVIAVSLVLAGLAVPSVPALVAAALRRLEPARLVEWTCRVLTAASDWLAGGLGFWARMEAISRVAAEVATRPPAVAGLVVAALLSIASLFALSQILASERSSRYA